MSHINYKISNKLRNKMQRSDRKPISFTMIKETIERSDDAWDQGDGGISIMKYFPQQRKWLRVIVEKDDWKKIITAYYDRDYKRKREREINHEQEEVYCNENDEGYAF